MRILFITSNRIGDAVLSTGLLHHLVGAQPQARFTVVCGPVAAPLFRAVPRLERLIPLAKRRFAAHWLALWAQCVGVRWDLVVDLRNSAVSRLLPSGAVRIHARTRGLVHKVTENAAVLGLDPPPAPHLWLDADATALADRLLPADGPILAVGPTANWTGKEWPAERFARLAERLLAPGGALAGGRVAVFAAASEVPRARPVLEALGTAAIDLTGRTDPLGAAACLRRAALYVGNDSGLMHIAAAVGTPTIGLFGPGFPDVYGPWGEHARAVTGTVPREALLARARTAGPAPTGLMDGISVEAVERAAVDLLRTARRRGTSCDEDEANAFYPAGSGPLR
ncbi:glycosyltransferase family 9 protein [Azospirillum sp. A39]|uniref:glycosyltransferase family 9 protein n=1 Tax=Azospirillum sp. A39 TaxID=3462279 RepID=UPI004045B98C